MMANVQGHRANAFYLPISITAWSWLGESAAHGGSRSRKLSSVTMSALDAMVIP